MDNPGLIEKLTNLIIRPHRQIYGLDRLGAKKILIKSKLTKHFLHAIRKDATIGKSKKIQLSIYQPQIQSTEQFQLDKQQNQQKFNQTSINKRVVIFLHSNSGSRLEGLQYLRHLLQYQFIVVIFDYSGSGISEGQYVTMGINQSKDLNEVYQYIKQQYKINQVALWGRSMGAATAIMFASKSPQRVLATIVDSPFSNFNQLIKQLVNKKTGLPQFLFSPIISRIQQCIKDKTGQDVFNINVKNFMFNMKTVKSLFLTCKEDHLVPAFQTQQLYQIHEGIKDLVYLQTNHNEPRTNQIKDKCSQFLYNAFLQYESSTKQENLKSKVLKSSIKDHYAQHTLATYKSTGINQKNNFFKQQNHIFNNKKTPKAQVQVIPTFLKFKKSQETHSRFTRQMRYSAINSKDDNYKKDFDKPQFLSSSFTNQNLARKSNQIYQNKNTQTSTRRIAGTRQQNNKLSLSNLKKSNIIPTFGKQSKQLQQKKKKFQVLQKPYYQQHRKSQSNISASNQKLRVTKQVLGATSMKYIPPQNPKKSFINSPILFCSQINDIEERTETKDSTKYMQRIKNNLYKS